MVPFRFWRSGVRFSGPSGTSGLGRILGSPSVKPAAVDALLRVKGPGHVLVVVCAARLVALAATGRPRTSAELTRGPERRTSDPLRAFAIPGFPGAEQLAAAPENPSPGWPGPGLRLGPARERNGTRKPHLQRPAWLRSQPVLSPTTWAQGKRRRRSAAKFQCIEWPFLFPFLSGSQAGQHVSHQRPGFTPVGSQPAGTVGRSQSPSPSHFWPQR